MIDSASPLNDSLIRAAVEAFRRAVVMYPSQTAFAAVVGTSQQNISKLIRHGRMCPRSHVLKVEAATGIPKEDLRPDLYPRPASVPVGGAMAGAGGTTTASRADPVPDSLSGLSA